MLYYVLLYYIILNYVLLYYIILNYVWLYYVILHHIIPKENILISSNIFARVQV